MTAPTNFRELVTELRRFDRHKPGVLPKRLPRGLTELTELQASLTDKTARIIVGHWIAWRKRERRAQHLHERTTRAERATVRSIAERDQDARLAR